MTDTTDLALSTSVNLIPDLAERRWAAGTHVGVMVLALLTAWMAGLAGSAAAAGVILVRPMNSDFVARHAKEAFNFNMSIFIYSLAGFLVGALFSVVTLGLGLILVVPIGLILMLFVAVLWVICSIQATSRALEGQDYRYPLTLRLWN